MDRWETVPQQHERKRKRGDPSTLTLLLLLVTTQGFSLTASSVTSFGITWTFDTTYTVGQYVTGDWWVVGPVTITDITQPANNAGRDGSMINPIPGWGDSDNQGYDSRMCYYSTSVNVALDLPTLVVPNGSSLVSSISRNPTILRTQCNLRDSSTRPILSEASVLTVVASEPAATDFRPPYAGTTKTAYSSVGLDLSSLTDYPPVTGAPTPAQVAGYFDRPWIDHVLEFLGDDMHPDANMENYGGGIARDVSVGALTLNTSITPAQKQAIAIGMTQLGIDNYYLVQNGAYWGDYGGAIGVGRKAPIILAGLFLGESALQNVAFSVTIRQIFQEDHQSFYLTQAERDGTYHPANCSGSSDFCHPGWYDSEPLGSGQWGERHYKWLASGGAYPYLPGKPGYRYITGGSGVGTTLAFRMMGIESLWNWDAWFDWMDRPAPRGGATDGCDNSAWSSQWACDMWDTYRNDLGDPPPPAGPDTYYVREGASGAGADWTFALPDLPATMTRGDVYYIADGSYAGYDFDTAEAGGDDITIIKATAADHGSETGWTPGYGDGQATFAYWDVTTSYWVFDGNTDTNRSYGFVVQGGCDTPVACVHLDGTGGASRRTDIEIYDTLIDPGGSVAVRGLYAFRQDNLLLQNISVQNSDGDSVRVEFADNPVLDNLYIHSRSGADVNAQAIELIGNMDTLTLRHSEIYWDGPQLYWGDAGTGIAGVAIHGSLFVGGLSGLSSASTITGLALYNNTIAGMSAASIALPGGTGDARNNLVWDAPDPDWGAVTHDYNWYPAGTSISESNIDTGTDPFVDYVGGDYHLSVATEPGDNTIGAAYNQDLEGNFREVDGYWDRGALEFTGGAPPGEEPTPLNVVIKLMAQFALGAAATVMVYAGIRMLA